MRSLRWVGLVFSLLIVGVLGGLMAPLPSEADNTKVTFQVDSGNVVTLLDVASGAASTCSQSGNTGCYLLTTGGQSTGNGPRSGDTDTRTFTSRNYLSSAAKLYMNDTSSLDSITLSTVEFLPLVTSGWGTDAANKGTLQAAPDNYGERHILRVVVTHTFNKTPHNTKTVAGDDASKYRFALRGSGMFIGNPANYTFISGATGSGDYVKFEGVARFGSGSTQTTLLSPFPPDDVAGALPACNVTNSKIHPTVGGVARIPSSDVNYCPLRRTIATTTAGSSSFSSNPALEQVNVTGNPYPKYTCDNGTDCTPTVILTFTATLNGPDSFVLSSSGDAAGGNCNHIRGDGGPSSVNAINCPKTGKTKGTSTDEATEAYFDAQDAADAPVFLAENAEPTLACEGEQCNCQDVNECPPTGTIKIVKYIDVNSFTTTASEFEATGTEISNFSLSANETQAGSKTFTGLSTGAGGGARTIKEISFPSTHESGGFDSVWRLDSVECVGTETPLAEGQVTKLYEGVGETLDGVRVNYVNNNQTVTCSFDNHHTHDGEDSPFGHPHPTLIIEQ